MMEGILSTEAKGPLKGLRVVEFLGIGPGPHAAMLLSDLGAEVLRIERDGGNGWPNAVADRGRATLAIDVRSDAGRARCLDILDHAGVLVEGFRPGTMERLGLGPAAIHARNPRLVYGRVTGWGQTGPLARAAGHDINYIALTGALAAIGRPGEPATPPLNLVGDFGGGSMLLVFGIMAALFERHSSGKGQVVDAAMVDGVTSLMGFFVGMAANGRLTMEREANLLGGAAPFYRCYVCADGKEIAVGAIEPQFYADLVDRIGAPRKFLAEQNDRARWPEQSATFAAIFASRPAAYWCGLLEGTDACFAPVLPLAEAAAHPHMAARGVHISRDGLDQAAPVPRFSRTPGAVQDPRDPAAMIDRWRTG